MNAIILSYIISYSRPMAYHPVLCRADMLPSIRQHNYINVKTGSVLLRPGQSQLRYKATRRLYDKLLTDQFLILRRVL